ncbi:DNA glycosylase [Peniophora sp. CONT]|nr:DNA glycosylase [Peniophora sp. CONT]
MVKRKAPSKDDSDFEASASEQSDYTPSSTKPKAKPKGATGAGRKRAKRTDSDEGLTIEGEDTFDLPAHAATRHYVGARSVPMQGALLAWFEGVHDARGMPWRKPFDASADADARSQRAYEVWVSEIMLQQTQVTTVIPYYNKWMERFPTVRDLAVSDIETVNALWKGLGYYSRAARLLAGAQKVVKEMNGRLPTNAADMQANMPGIGRYTAGAICSIAYGEQVPVLDGNVTRLMSRVLAVHAPPKSKQTLDTLWQGAADLVHGCEQAGMLNQALIELGATICKPREPSCGDCPVKSWCTAYSIAQKEQDLAPLPDIEDACTQCVSIPRSGSASKPQVTAYPMAVVRKKQREETDAVFVLEWRSTDDGAERLFLLVKRPNTGLLAGLHEFPTMENPSSAQSDDNAHLGSVIMRYIENGSQLLESPRQPSDVPHVAKVQTVGDVVHVFSHIRKTYRVSWVVLTGTGGPPALRAPTGAQPTQKKSTRTKKVASVSANNGGVISPPHSAWIKLSDVEHANVGTGVMKIWKMVNAGAGWAELE